jgi:hypothetical protein
VRVFWHTLISMFRAIRKRGSSGTYRLTASLCLASTLVVLVSTASVSGASKAGESTKPVGPHVPPSGGVVRVTGYSDNDGPTSRVIVTGVIGDYGKALRTNSDKELDLQLTHGSFGLNIATLESDLDSAIEGHFPTNTTTCSGEVSVSGGAAVDSGSGTGAYKGLSGTFTLTITINEVEAPPRCPKTDTSPFLAQSVFITGSGTVSLPR